MWRRPPRPACTSGSVRTARLRAEEGEGPAVGRQRKKLLIVDGYNVLRSGIRYRRIEDPDYTDDAFNVARERLINDVVNYAGNDWRAIIVFDGGRNAFSTGRRKPWAACASCSARRANPPTRSSRSWPTTPRAASGNACGHQRRHHPRHRVRQRLRPHERRRFQPRGGMYYEDARLDEAPKDGAEEHPRRAGEPRGAGQAKGPPRR